MALYPVIMCGGAGSRLWPAARTSRPKPFIALTGERSLFHETVLRVAPLTRAEGRLVIVAGLEHQGWIAEQLAEAGVEATVLLEPEPRDSAPAMAAAAAWVAAHDPEAIVAVVASDHHIPDDEALRTAILTAAETAYAGRIVTLGVKPRDPSSAYGYILPAGGPDMAVARFVEKPDPATAERYIREGYLWNSGNFVVSVRTLMDELDRHAPEVASAARQAVAGLGDAPAMALAEAFRSAPKVSIDYAVMEKTDRASVLPVDFQWSDLGAWDSIAATGSGDDGLWLAENTEDCLVRAAPGMVVATVGVSRIAVVAEPDAVLVCDLSQSQSVKTIVERLRRDSPAHADMPQAAPEPLVDGADRFARWLRMSALPLWGTLGVADDGGFYESLTLRGPDDCAFRRARVQARQIHVYATAGMLGWRGPWRVLAERAAVRFREHNLRADGLYRTLTDGRGGMLDDTASLYDQAFVLFSLAATRRAGVRREDSLAEARALLAALTALRAPSGGWREAVGGRPFQANAHMHLFEAALAWETLDPDGGWSAVADEIAALALTRFIDSDGGFLREFFTAEWAPAPGDDGRLVEPGHQFEWAWLLTGWGRARGRADALEAAKRLYATGRRGVCPRRDVVMDEMDDALTPRSTRARLWPQTERLRAALILAEDASPGERRALLDDAAAALRGLWLYLEPDGLWKDKLGPDGAFLAEPAPATSFYHILSAFQQIIAAGPLMENRLPTGL